MCGQRKQGREFIAARGMNKKEVESTDIEEQNGPDLATVKNGE